MVDIAPYARTVRVHHYAMIIFQILKVNSPPVLMFESMKNPIGFRINIPGYCLLIFSPVLRLHRQLNFRVLSGQQDINRL